MNDDPGLSEIEDRYQARNEYASAHWQGVLQRLFSFFGDHRSEMLSLSDIKSIVKPTSEAFAGIQTVEIERIVGSEDRYADFSRSFLPRTQHSRDRWVNIRMAHFRGIELPPITLYELGGIYFVRDGNHRVSVAKRLGAQYIDAEVTSLASKIALHPEMTREEIKESIIELERKQFYSETGLDNLRPRGKLVFSETGRYQELFEHIKAYRSCLREMRREEVPFEEAMLAWYDEFFFPVVTVVEEERLLRRFPGRTAADLYLWIVKHQTEVNKCYRHISSIRSAVRSFADKYGKYSKFGRSLRQKVKGFLRRLLPR